MIMAWYSKNTSSWMSIPVVAWFLSAITSWWTHITSSVGATWDDTVATWDSISANWDDVSFSASGEWYEKSPNSWQTPNN